MLIPLFLALECSSLATTVLFQGDVRGGVSVDAVGVDAHAYSLDTYAPSEELWVQVPDYAVTTQGFLILHAKLEGFGDVTGSGVRLNGFPISEFGTVVFADETTEVYNFDPSLFGIYGASRVTYTEQGVVERSFRLGPGINGATLVVLYEDWTFRGLRHIVVATDNVSDGLAVLEGLPADTNGEAVISIGVSNECSNDQSNIFSVNGIPVSNSVGGRDDGPDFDGSCGTQDWNSLITQGSFGFDNTNLLVGVDGDSPDTEPIAIDSDGDGIMDGRATNSRLSDELFRVPYDGSGSMTVGYSDDSEDSIMATVIAVFELDSDADGIEDALDNCPDIANPEQIDSDLDGFGDACDECTDSDLDGFCSDEDCDDSNPSVFPGALESWYDGIDSDCGGDSDFDQDYDGSDSTDYGGDDCDDTDPSFGPDVAEVWYDGVDQNCGEDDDFDADGDGYVPSEYEGYPTVDVPDSGALPGGDCDDGAPYAFPGGFEVWYDGVDQDCDGNDADFDLDGYDSSLTGGSDCDDEDADIHPTALEVWYDGLDQDCDGNDADKDRDGFLSTSVSGGDDCDDSDPDVYVGASEIWYDGVDQDCDGGSDYDQDGDGYDTLRFGGEDCDDESSAIHPGRAELWYDGIDADCSGGSDFDQDGDGYDALRYGGEDCDDTNESIQPAAEDIADDGIDQDCDGADASNPADDGSSADGDTDESEGPSSPWDPDFGTGSTSSGEGWSDDDDDDRKKGCSTLGHTHPHWALVVLPLLIIARRRAGRVIPTPFERSGPC